MQFKGKHVVITGGGTGIGLEMARSLSQLGAEVVITGRREAPLKAAAEGSPKITAFVCDVTNNDDVIRLLEFMDSLGGADVIINNAGIMQDFDIKAGFSLDKQLHEIAINSAGPVRFVHHFLPGLLKRPSMIVNVSSGLAYVPYWEAPVYSASKAFLHSYTQSLRSQLAGTSVRVVELLPPVVDTSIVGDLETDIPKMPPEKLISEFLRNLDKGNDEITPGMSNQLKWMSRIAPKFIYNQLNKPKAKSS